MQRKALYILLLIGLIVAPFAGVYPVFIMKVLCFALFAAAFNLLIGYTGLLSFGHAMFLATAGYITGYAIQSMNFTPELGVILGTLAATVLGIVVGLLAIRRQGIYFAMVTLALAQMIYFVFLQAPFTHGVIDLNSDIALYYIVLVVMLLAFALIVRIVHSPFGQVLIAIKENEPRAISLGYDTARYKLLAFVLSAGLAGLAGSLKTVVLGFETLGDAYWTISGLVVLMTLVRRHEHDVRVAARRVHHRAAGRPVRRYRRRTRESDGHRLVQFARRVGDDRDRRDFHRVRAGVPARHRR